MMWIPYDIVKEYPSITGRVPNPANFFKGENLNFQIIRLGKGDLIRILIHFLDKFAKIPIRSFHAFWEHADYSMIYMSLRPNNPALKKIQNAFNDGTAQFLAIRHKK